MTLSAPTFIPMAWAGGTGVNVGNLVSPSSATAAPLRASWNDGFPIQQMTNGSGYSPQGGDMNGILNWITTFQLWVQSGGQFLFNSANSTNIGGYPAGAVVQLNGGGGMVISTSAGNTNDPNSNMAGWRYAYGLACQIPQTSIAGPAGSLYFDTTNGMSLRGLAGSIYDFALSNALGSQILAVYTGTQNVLCSLSSSSATWTMPNVVALSYGTQGAVAPAAGMAGSVYYNGTNGLIMQGKAGSMGDFAIFSRDGTQMVAGILDATPKVWQVGGKQNMNSVSNAAPLTGDLWLDATQQTICAEEGYSTSPILVFKSGVIATQKVAPYGVAITQNVYNDLMASGNLNGTTTLPVNFLVVGKTIKVELWGLFVPTGSSATSVSIMTGATALLTLTTPAISSVNNYVKLEFVITCTTAGAGGVVSTSGSLMSTQTNGGSPVFCLATGNAVSKDTTATTPLTIKGTFTASAGTITVSNSIVSVLG